MRQWLRFFNAISAGLAQCWHTIESSLRLKCTMEAKKAGGGIKTKQDTQRLKLSSYYAGTKKRMWQRLMN